MRNTAAIERGMPAALLPMLAVAGTSAVSGTAHNREDCSDMIDTRQHAGILTDARRADVLTARVDADAGRCVRQALSP